MGQRRRDEGKTTSCHIYTATQRNQGDDRCTSEGGGRQKLKHVDGDFPVCMRRENDVTQNKTRRNEDSKGRGGGRLKLSIVDGDVPLCMRSFDEEKKDSSSSKKDNKDKMVSGSSVSSSRKKDSRSKMASGSKDLCGNTTEKKNQ